MTWLHSKIWIVWEKSCSLTAVGSQRFQTSGLIHAYWSLISLMYWHKMLHFIEELHLELPFHSVSDCKTSGFNPVAAMVLETADESYWISKVSPWCEEMGHHMHLGILYACASIFNAKHGTKVTLTLTTVCSMRNCKNSYIYSHNSLDEMGWSGMMV